MFEREQHQKILIVLNHLNADFLADCGVYFGGGTLVSLKHGEHRLSQDIDFMCSFDTKYSHLRREIGDRGYNALFANFNSITLPREIQADRYGIRFPVVVLGSSIKLEIVAEGLIEFGSPDYPSWSPVACLNETDSVAEKLLANTDRWAEQRRRSRDLIDLCVQRLTSPLPDEAITKAENVYPALKNLKKAILHFQSNSDYRQTCFEALAVNHPASIIDGLDLLASDFGIQPTTRMFSETNWQQIDDFQVEIDNHDLDEPKPDFKQ